MKFETIGIKAKANYHRKVRLILKKVILAILTITVSLSIVFSIQAHPAEKVPILLYHHILSESENKNFKDNSCVVSLENFEQQMKYLYDNGFHTVTLQELEDFLYNGKLLPDKSVVITFDDGYYSNIIRAYPILKKYSFRAVIFMISSTTRDNQKGFNPDLLEFIAKDSMEDYKDVFEYASHTYDLHESENGDDKSPTKLVKATTEQIQEDFSKSFEYVNNHKAFAYPRGQYNETIIETLKKIGIKMAMTTKEGYVVKAQNPLELNRFIIYRNTPFSNFKSIVDSKK